ncbi:MAG: AAA family ATPase [Muribaculaceae bacterium]|nr:AAA family ATPase [Muribaculaceae bacterium]
MKEKKPFFERFFENNRNMYLIIAVVLASMLVAYVTMPRPEDTTKMAAMEYPVFLEHLKAGEVDQIRYSRNDEFMTVTLFNDETKSMDIREREAYAYQEDEKFAVKYPGGDSFRADLLAAGADPTMYVASTSFMDVLSTILSFVMFGSMIFLLVILLRSGPMKEMMGNKEKDLLKTSEIKFADVIGQDETIEDLKFIVDLMKDPKIGEDIGAKVPKGLLLQGPPGTGKTLLAKAVAGEAGVPFVQMSGSAFIEMYVGVGAQRVRNLFKVARKNAPCVVFIDEIDAVGMKRDKAGSTSENDQTINALLEQMDGFDARDGVFIIAATNRPGQLDEALIRPGRFDRQVTVNPPRDWTVREELFRHYLDGLKLDESVDIANLSKQTPGFTGADIAAICNEAGIIAAMAGKPTVDTACLEEAIDKKVFQGSRSKRDHYRKDKEIIAVHEAGHAAMNWICGEGIARASIQGTTSGVGGAVFSEDRPNKLMTAREIRNRVMVAYAGRAAEEIKFQDPSTGASNDITEATKLLTAYCEQLGFDESVGLIDMTVLMQNRLADAATTAKHISAISRQLYNECKALLEKNFQLVEALSQALLERETMPGPEIEAMFARIKPMPGRNKD